MNAVSSSKVVVTLEKIILFLCLSVTITAFNIKKIQKHENEDIRNVKRYRDVTSKSMHVNKVGMM